MPPPLQKENLIVIAQLIAAVSPFSAAHFFGEGLNLRLGTKGLDFSGILTECDRRGITIWDLMAAPEQDSWVYSDGRSMVREYRHSSGSSLLEIVA
jgi:hypothetical protein